MMERKSQDRNKTFKKIAYMVADFPGISETFIIREIQTLLDKGFDITILAIVRPEDYEREESLCRKSTIELCHYARPENTLRHLYTNAKLCILHPFKYFRTAKIFMGEVIKHEPKMWLRIIYHFYCGIGFTELIKKKGIQHIHAHFSTGTNMALAAASFLNLPFSFTAHASGDIFVKPILLEEKISRSEFVITVCDYGKKYLDCVTGGRFSNKFHRIYNGIEKSEFMDPGEMERISNEAKEITKIISVGRLVDCKGFKTLIDACKRLVDRKYAVSCEIIGDGPEREILLRQISNLGLNKCINITGYLPLSAIYDHLRRADIFVLLSEIGISGYRDGFPTVILEAMHIGLPIVSTWVSGIPEMVINKETGLLVHERDSQGAAVAIEALIMNKTRRKTFGHRGKERAISIFCLEKNIEMLACFLKERVKE